MNIKGSIIPYYSNEQRIKFFLILRTNPDLIFLNMRDESILSYDSGKSRGYFRVSTGGYVHLEYTRESMSDYLEKSTYKRLYDKDIMRL